MLHKYVLALALCLVTAPAALAGGNPVVASLYAPAFRVPNPLSPEVTNDVLHLAGAGWVNIRGTAKRIFLPKGVFTIQWQVHLAPMPQTEPDQPPAPILVEVRPILGTLAPARGFEYVLNVPTDTLAQGQWAGYLPTAGIVEIRLQVGGGTNILLGDIEIACDGYPELCPADGVTTTIIPGSAAWTVVSYPEGSYRTGPLVPYGLEGTGWAPGTPTP